MHFFPKHGVFVLPLLLLLACGCMDGPFYAIKRINPYYHAQWAKDRKLGKTYEQRLKELDQFESQVADFNATEKKEWSETLASMVREDASPELRIRAIRGLAQLETQAAAEGLNQAASDEVEKVRIAACEAWGSRGDVQSRNMLLSLAAKDNSSSVRQAAIATLSRFDHPEVMQTLGNLLDDESPAVMYGAVQSLASLTGQDYGGDVEGWKEYLASRTPSVSEPTQPGNDLDGLPALPFPQLPNSQAPVRTASGPNGLPK